MHLNYIKKAPPIRLMDFNTQELKVFIKNVLIPYFSSVFTSILEGGSKLDYLTLNRLRKYLNLPPILAMRICYLINDNGDSRIDHDEFIKFFLNLIAGSFEKKMHIAF